jgi:hypothetical protein
MERNGLERFNPSMGAIATRITCNGSHPAFCKTKHTPRWSVCCVSVQLFFVQIGLVPCHAEIFGLSVFASQLNKDRGEISRMTNH